MLHYSFVAIQIGPYNLVLVIHSLKEYSNNVIGTISGYTPS